MTQEPPSTPVDDIVVYGQRRRPGGVFPSGPGGGGGSGDSGGDQQNEVTDPGLEPYVPPPHPCDNPQSALEWNADAAAAEAAKEFARRAAARNPPENLHTREWGAYLYRDPDGSIRVGPINFGDPFQLGGVGSVELFEDGPPGTIVGFVHSHGSGSHLPSDGPPDNPGDVQVLDSVIAYTGNPSMRMYIVAPNQGPAGHVPYNQINVYNSSNARSSRDSFTPGPEVNPEAQPCG